MKVKKFDLFCLIGAYSIWGILPLYWRQLSAVPAEVVFTHRVFWSIIFLALVLLLQARARSTLVGLFSKKIFYGRLIAAILVTVNWLTYVWAMGHGRIAESGLGYFICPLVSIVLGALVFGEQFTTQQKFGVGLVTLGVLIKIFSAGVLPWVALALAISWALYGTVRKAQGTEPVSSLFQEVLIIFPLILAYELCFNLDSLFQWYGFGTSLLLIASGPITALPVLMLVQGLKTVPLSSMALVQFLAPSLMLVVALFYGETLKSADLISYLFIWSGIAFYAGLKKWLKPFSNNKLFMEEAV